jgi:hypothetical protein
VVPKDGEGVQGEPSTNTSGGLQEKHPNSNFESAPVVSNYTEQAVQAVQAVQKIFLQT